MNVVNVVVFFTQPVSLRAVNLAPTNMLTVIMSCRLVLNIGVRGSRVLRHGSSTLEGSDPNYTKHDGFIMSTGRRPPENHDDPGVALQKMGRDNQSLHTAATPSLRDSYIVDITPERHHQSSIP